MFQCINIVELPIGKILFNNCEEITLFYFTSQQQILSYLGMFLAHNHKILISKTTGCAVASSRFFGMLDILYRLYEFVLLNEYTMFTCFILIIY